MLIFPVSLNLVKHFSLELKPVAWPDMLQSIQDLLALSILLVPELVGWECQNSKFIRELLAEFIHLREVSDSCSSQGGGVLHQDDLPLVVGQADHLP